MCKSFAGLPGRAEGLPAGVWVSEQQGGALGCDRHNTGLFNKNAHLLSICSPHAKRRLQGSDNCSAASLAVTVSLLKEHRTV